jgi:hypothetical protein
MSGHVVSDEHGLASSVRGKVEVEVKVKAKVKGALIGS